MVIRVLIFVIVTGCAYHTQPALSEQERLARTQARLTLAIAYLKHNNLTRAHANLQTALQYSPDHTETQLTLAHYYSRLNEYDLAQKQYQQLLRRHPHHVRVLNHYATFLCKNSHYQRANKLYEQALALRPHQAQVYTNAGLCAMKAQHHKQAEHYLTLAVTRAPTQPTATLALAELYIHQGEIRRAHTYLLDLKQKGVAPKQVERLLAMTSASPHLLTPPRPNPAK